MYIASVAGVQGLLASLMPDQMYPASKDVCYIRFWYYMHTNHQIAENVDLGTLRVYLEGEVFLVFAMTLCVYGRKYRKRLSVKPLIKVF